MTTWRAGTDTPAVDGAGRYRLDLLLDRSDLGDTWQGWDLLDRRPVTVRVVPIASRALRERWAELEGGWRQALVGLRHPAVVRVLDLVSDGEQVLVVSELHGGALSLRQLGLEPRPDGEVAALLAPVAEALAYVHRAGLPHLALSPSWILVGRDGETLLDGCGLAPLADAAGRRRGTDGDDVAYRAPEGTADDPGGPAADVFALGRTIEALLQPVDAPAAGGGRPLRRLADAMTQRDPAQRPTAREAADRLAQLAAPGAPTRATRRVAYPPLDEPVEPRHSGAGAEVARPRPPRPRPRRVVSRPRARVDRAPTRGRLSLLATRGGAILAVIGAVGLAFTLLDDGAATPSGTTATGPAATSATASVATETAPEPTSPAAETATEPETPAVLELVPGPSAVCPFAMPAGWEVVAVDQARGAVLRTETRAPDDSGRLFCDAAVPTGGPARAAAAAARASRNTLRGFTGYRFGPRDGTPGGAWVWEYAHQVDGARVRVQRVFLNGGDALGLQAAESEFEALRPTFTAVVAGYERGGA